MQRFNDKIDSKYDRFDDSYRYFLSESSVSLYEYDGMLPSDDDFADHYRVVRAHSVA